MRDTEFDETVVLGVQIGSSSQSSALQMLGVERETTGTVHAYTCIARRGHTDDWAPFARLLRLPHDGEVPAGANLTHWEEGNEQTFE